MFRTFVRPFWNRVLVGTLHRIEGEQRQFLASPESNRVDVRVIGVLITVAIVLTLQNYFSDLYSLVRLVHSLGVVGFPVQANALRKWALELEHEGIGTCYWAVFSFATYFFIPWLVIRVLFRQRLADFGFKIQGALADWWIYVVFFLFICPLLLWVSTHAHFQRTYPFFKPHPGEHFWSSFWLWEVCYLLQFVGLEFFFRGFMVHGTKHRFGVYTIFVMTVPYCMVHFGKPFLETLAAIIAGVVLGFMSLKTRSIWMGVAIHASVALSMDFLSLWRQGQFDL